jgi:hypothetical protein
VGKDKCRNALLGTGRTERLCVRVIENSGVARHIVTFIMPLVREFNGDLVL